MHLMLVNDDGIQAPGIRAMCIAAAQAGYRVSVCAPDGERSAASHSISLRKPLRIRREEVPGAEAAYAVDGTPSDCARLGIYLFGDVDIVLSGVNNGSNMGSDCVYSGTVGAAMEASMAGVPALAVSLCAHNVHEYDASVRIALRVLQWMTEHPLPQGAIYNLNVPLRPYEEIPCVRAAHLAPYYPATMEYLEEKADGGKTYTQTRSKRAIDEWPANSDIGQVRSGFATLTALSWDMRLRADDPDTSGILL